MTAMALGNRFLQKASMTHLRVQRLSFLAFGSYLAKTGKWLGNEEPVSFNAGPGFLSIYGKLSRFDQQLIPGPVGDEVGLVDMLENDGGLQDAVINEVMERYGYMPTKDLGIMCNYEGGPWAISRQNTYSFAIGPMNVAEIQAAFRVH